MEGLREWELSTTFKKEKINMFIKESGRMEPEAVKGITYTLITHNTMENGLIISNMGKEHCSQIKGSTKATGHTAKDMDLVQ